MIPVNSLLQRIPFIRISGLFVLGILVNHYLLTDNKWAGVLFLLLISWVIYQWNNKHFAHQQIHNILLSFLIFLSGIFYPTKTSEKQLSTIGKNDFYIAEICQRPIEKYNTYQTYLWVRSKSMAHSEKVIAYFDKMNFDTTLMAGDQLLVYTKLQKIKGKTNEYDFDYRLMMNKLGINYSVYLSSSRYKKTGIQINKLIYIAERLRDKLIVLLNSTHISKNELAVISALALGYRSELDKEIRDYFADTGTIHVLSVSGLHVALIFYILNLLLTPINRGKLATYIYPVLMIMLLWCYAFITGFSPPVQRATFMFSFVIIGNILRRPINIYNSLFASAFILILYDPVVLFDIGFQLSYLAIFGIILLQPPFDKMVTIKNKSLKWVWTLFTVSLAAQITTFPLSIFYFKQFPNLFWLSNFIAMPGTTLILWLTILFFILNPLTILSNSIAVLLQFITHHLLFVLKWLSNLPHSVSEGIIYNQFQTIIMYGLIFAIIFYSFSKHKKWLYSSLILLICFQSANLYTKFNLFNQEIVYVYHSESSIIHCINGRNSYIFKNTNNPYSSFDIERIENVCDHLKLLKPKFIKTNELGSIIMKDLIVKRNNLNFLNCNINFKDSLNFCIKGEDLRRFRLANPLLIEKISSQNKLYNADSLEDTKGSFSLDFSVQDKEALCIFIK